MAAHLHVMQGCFFSCSIHHSHLLWACINAYRFLGFCISIAIRVRAGVVQHPDQLW